MASENVYNLTQNTYLSLQEVVHKIGNLFYTCKFCGKQYHKYEKEHYISHMQTKHLMDQQFPCSEVRLSPSSCEVQRSGTCVLTPAPLMLV